jgi:hypothetical protein
VFALTSLLVIVLLFVGNVLLGVAVWRSGTLPRLAGAVWALAAVPMGVLGWIVLPLLAPDFGSDPLGFGVIRLVLITLGLVWLFVLSMIIVRREEGDLRWATVKRRLRLNTPRDPTTGRPRARL